MDGPSTVAPITGYGDFGAVEYYEVDWFYVTELTVLCANDQGFPVTILSPGDGWSFAAIPYDQHAAATEIMEACAEGLNLPPPAPLTNDQIRTHYDALLTTKECLESEGYDIAEPPSVETFVDSWSSGPWHPYHSIPDTVGQAEWERLNVACPQP